MKEMHSTVDSRSSKSAPQQRASSLCSVCEPVPALASCQAASGKSFADRLSRRWWQLEAKTLCAQAQRRTKLYDFGHPPLDPGLSILLESLERQADLKPLGRFLMRTHL